MKKKELRTFFLKKRATLCESSKKEYDEIICRRIISTDEFKRAKSVLAYYPIRKEIDILPVIYEALNNGKSVAFPKCCKNGIMEFKYVNTVDDLFKGAYNIPEPSESCVSFRNGSHALCIVPALSYDFLGYRLGYGGGYYDRFLSDFKGIAMGVAYSDFIVSALPHNSYDKKISKIITEGGAIDIKDERANEKTFI